MNKAIGFIGLGVMGYPIAGHLSNHHKIRVFNRSLEKTKSWLKKYSGFECSSVKEISEASEIALRCEDSALKTDRHIKNSEGAAVTVHHSNFFSVNSSLHIGH